MQKKDLKLLWMFTLRIGMYTGKENKDTVLSFLHGYEIGRNNECHFIEKLSQSIEEEYQLESRATGWIGQIERLAEQLEMDWITIFKKQSLKVLTKAFDETEKIEFSNSIRKRINGKMSGIKHHFQRNWITDWFGIVDLTANWFKEIWSERELELMTEIEEELISFGKIRALKKDIEPTERLKTICRHLYEKVNKF